MIYKLSRSCQIPSLAVLYNDLFGDRTDGYFVDVGAGDGETWSNTSCLADVGWSGVMVEPVPHLARLCERRHKNIRVVQSCVGDEDYVTGKLYIGGVNTTREDMIQIYNSVLGVGLDEKNYIECQFMTLDTILDMAKTRIGFEVLSIDVEGAERTVLQGFSCDYWSPKMCIIETHTHHPNQSMNIDTDFVYEYFEQYGYRNILSDAINSIFVSCELIWHSPDCSTPK